MPAKRREKTKEARGRLAATASSLRLAPAAPVRAAARHTGWSERHARGLWGRGVEAKCGGTEREERDEDEVGGDVQQVQKGAARRREVDDAEAGDHGDDQGLVPRGVVRGRLPALQLEDLRGGDRARSHWRRLGDVRGRGVEIAGEIGHLEAE